MKLNFKVRLKNKVFWLTLIPALLILVQAVLALFGVTADTAELETRLLDLVNALFAVLAILGIVADPTTEGLHDSDRAMLYEKPWVDTEIEAMDK